MTIRAESFLMRAARRFGAERLAWALRRLHCPVPADALVLEVGSGGNPYARANVLLDAYEVTRERHWTPLVTDRPTVLGFVENLPFHDGAFDFVIASHVLEHSADPARFITELQRVARAGYIETPDAFMERINPYRDHRLEVTLRNGKLMLRKKPHWCPDRELVELYEYRAKQPVTRELIPKRPFAFHVRYLWEGNIAFEVVNPETNSSWSSPIDGVCAHAPDARRGLRAVARDVLRTLFSQRARNRRLDILSLLRCPGCYADVLEKRGNEIMCKGCGTAYAMPNNVPRMYTSG